MVNRLDDETSPYLRQHRDNPVDWYPWGPQAFDEAARRDRPVLLSVGYSACHWCHVMAHESFEDPETAEVMNRLFVNVKVDREERPDVDAVYMDAVQALTGRGGWPMTVFLTPTGEPFFAGTYFPDRPRGGMASFRQVLEAIDEAWTQRRGMVDEQAGELRRAIARSAGVKGASSLPPAPALTAALERLEDVFDSRWGGFGPAPKFPAAMLLDTLLQHHSRRPHPQLLAMATHSLDAMAAGGIYDHLGGGFARYSVDERWLVPHFEKMLYDNALLTRTYLHAWQVTGSPRYLEVLTETIGYVLRDLTHPQGGFHAAEDADSEGVEGRFYVWSEAEIRQVCGADADSVIGWYGVTASGNFEGANILHRPVGDDSERPPAVERGRRALFEHRRGRVRPGLDDKVLTEWNGLMLAALAEAAAATGDAGWREAAVANGEFLVARLRRDDGRWLRSWQSDDTAGPGQARHLAYAQDHAALVDGFTRLGELTGEARWISVASETAHSLIDLFWDHEAGGVFTTGSDAEALITRPKDLMDNATPSAQSLTARSLSRLAALTGDTRLAEHGEETLALVAELAITHPTAFGHALSALDLMHHGFDEVVVTGDRADLVATVHESYRPGVVLAWGEPYESGLWAGRDPDRAYVCRDFACRLPATTVDELVEQLA